MRFGLCVFLISMIHPSTIVSRNLEERVFLNILKISIVSVLIFLANAAFVLGDITLIIANSIAVTVLIVMYLLSKYRSLYKKLVLPYTLFVLAALNTVWFSSGGFVSSTSYIIFAIIIVGIIVSRHQYTWFLTAFISVNVLVLYSIEYFNPGISIQFDKQKDIISHAMVFLAVIAIINYLIIQLKNSYDDERNKVKRINDDLLYKNLEINQQNAIIQAQNKELKSYSEDLEKKVTERTALLSDMNRDLTTQNLTLEQFTFITAHNLRSPVAQIKGLINLITYELRDKNTNIDTIEHLQESATNLEEVIHDITRILNIKKGGEKLERINLKEQLSLAKAILQNDITAKNIDISITCDESLHIDGIRAYIQSIFYNLIHNAIKYSSKERRPAITINIESSDTSVVLKFQDNGIGIDMKYASEKIFQLYQRFNTEYQGKGYGLFLTKTQVEAMRGDISVSSILHQGTTFTLSFPLSS